MDKEYYLDIAAAEPLPCTTPLESVPHLPDPRPIPFLCNALRLGDLAGYGAPEASDGRSTFQKKGI